MFNLLVFFYNESNLGIFIQDSVISIIFKIGQIQANVQNAESSKIQI